MSETDTYIARSTEAVVRGTGAKSISYDLLGLTLEMPSGLSLFIAWECVTAMAAIRHEVEQAVVSEAREAARAKKAVLT
jgi:hypothetical protein